MKQLKSSILAMQLYFLGHKRLRLQDLNVLVCYLYTVALTFFLLCMDICRKKTAI